MSGTTPQLVERIDDEGRPFMGFPDPGPEVQGQIIDVAPRGAAPLPAGEGAGQGAGPGEGAGGGAGDRQGGGAVQDAAPGADAPPPMRLAEAQQPPASYEDYRAERAAVETVQRARQRQTERRRQQQPAPTPPEPPPTQEDRVAARDAYAAQMVARLAPQDTGAGAPEGDAPGDMPTPPQPPERGPRQARRTPEAQSTARTVLRNAAEAVTGVPRGALAAFASLFEAGDDLADWIAGTTSETMPNTPGRMIGRGIRSLQPGREPETVSGRISEEISQFVVGFMRGGALLRRYGVLQGGGAARAAGRAAAAGAMADFFYNEANDDNLAATWQRMGMPGNALTEFLATDPNDDAAINRLRNAAAGVVVGAALDGVLALARAARAARAARRDAPPPAPAAAEAAGVPARPDRDLMLFGDASRPLVEIGPRPADAGQRMADAAAVVTRPGERSAEALANARVPVETVENTAAIRAATEPGEVFINWGRIATPEDVQAVLRDMAEAFRGRVNEAGRGVQTNEETARLASMLNLTPEQLLSRRPGEAWNAETALAARQLYTASGERLLEAARAAAATGAGALEAAAFRRMMATHYAIQAEVLGARREAGRALQAWSIPAAAGGRQMRMIEDLMEASGGIETAQAMARRLAMLADNLPADKVAGAVSGFTNRGWGGRTIEAVQQYWINALLSNPATHLANIIGNGLNLPLNLIERGVQAQVGRLTGSADAANALEAPVMLYGMLTGFRDALRLGARTYADDGVEVARMIGRQDLPRQGAISSQAWGLDAGSGFGRALDFAGHQIVSAPGRAMGAEDAFFKSIIFRMELHAQSLRQAVREVPRRADGSMDQAAIGARMAEILRDPPEAVRVAAAAEALYRTFNREAGPISQALLRARNTDSPGWNLGMATVLPFIRTPANLFSYGLERTPLAPLVGQWRADVAAGGARRDAALARVALGSMILAHTFQMAEQGFVNGNGPSDPRERDIWRQAGNQPYSIRVGDQWVPFNRLDPYGFILGFAADARELLDRRDLGKREEADMAQLIAGVTSMASNALADRSFFSGVASVAAALDPNRRSMEPYIERTIGSLVVPGIAASVVQAFNPTQYDRGQGWVTSRLGSIANSDAIPRRNVWGEEVRRPGVDTLGQVGAALSPVKPTRISDRPIDRELQRLGIGIDDADQNGTVTFGLARVGLRSVNPAALDQLRRWSGNEMGLPAFNGLGMADALDEMVQGRGPYGERFMMASDDGRERAIRQVAMLYRRAARDRLLADPRFEDVAELVGRRRAEVGEGRGEVPIPSSTGAAQRAPGEPAPRRGQQPAVR
jgi:hypothetical protein